MIARRKTFSSKIGHIYVGSDHPIVVQSMTNTDTEDALGTAIQVADLARAGSEVVRITVNTIEAGAKVREISQRLADMGLNVPLVGDFHFNGHKILAENPDCAKYLAKYRINPGNVGKGSKRDEQFAYMINTAREYDKPVRIGVNWGSLDQELLASMLDNNARLSVPLSLDEVMRKALVEYDKLFTGNVIAVGRMKGLGLLSKEEAISYAVTGPAGRASGFSCDIRKHIPYALYDKVEFNEVIRENGDSFDRYLNRLDEIEESLKIIEQLIDNIPDGDYLAKTKAIIKTVSGRNLSKLSSHLFDLIFCIDEPTKKIKNTPTINLYPK